MKVSLPFMLSTGLITKIFHKIKEAREPERFTVDFQSTVLGFGSGSAKAFIGFAKRLGFLESDGKPTDIYRQFRNGDTAGAAMAKAMKLGFKPIFDKNEYAGKLSDEKLKNLVIELTGAEKDDRTLQAVLGSFKACRLLADFDAELAPNQEVNKSSETAENRPPNPPSIALTSIPSGVGMNFSYTINLNLPETTDINVFNAIFASLKDNLLK